MPNQTHPIHQEVFNAGAATGGGSISYDRAPTLDLPSARAEEYSPPRPEDAKNWVGIAAIITGLIVPPLGVLFGHLGLRAANAEEANNRTLALGGLLLGYLLTASVGLYFGLMFVFDSTTPTFE